MFGDLFIIHPETIWVLIPLAAIIGAYITKWQRTKAENARHGAADAKIVQEMHDAIQRLEQRVSNLERAVTTAETERKFAL